MKLSNKGRYAVRALFDIAFHNDGGPTQVKDIAQRQAIPPRFLEQIFQDLKRAGIVSSKRGPQGGYSLARPALDVRLGDVVRALEGPLAPLPCASERSFQPCEECVDVDSCGTRMIMREVRDEIARILDGTTLAQIIAKEDEARESGKPDSLMFYI